MPVSWLLGIPGLKIACPATPGDAKGLLKASIRDDNPVLFLEHKRLYTVKGPVDGEPVPLGQAAVAREGGDLTLVTAMKGVHDALEAAERLSRRGIEVTVIDLRTLRPLDIDTVLASVRKTNRIVTVEEGWPICSIGSEICARVALEAFDDLDAPPAKISGADVPMPYAANLEKLALPSVEQVVAAVKSVCYRE
jgi:pyruvate dehydrogenase E1 component beta subunit